MPHRIGSVSYLNAKPLIFGLDERDDVQLHLDVPSRLLDGLRQNRFDVALLPIIDYQRLDGLRMLSVGGIGSDGPTLTVRIFSRVPVHEISTLACDTDSHTSVALARIILAEAFQIQPEFVDLSNQSAAAHAQLLIGDKVVAQEPADFPHQLDLGQAWKTLTGLPFVFAAWMVPHGVEVGELAGILQSAKEAGLGQIAQIVRRHAQPRGWPPGLAGKYLTENLTFDIGPAQLRAIGVFFEFAARHHLIASPPRPLVLAGTDPI
jgi:chorismate dehydratase